jgi:hypothetical protein
MYRKIKSSAISNQTHSRDWLELRVRAARQDVARIARHATAGRGCQAARPQGRTNTTPVSARAGRLTVLGLDFDGELLSPDNLSRDWCRMCDRRRLPRCSFHALRHIHASLLLRAGVDVLTVSRRLGHDNPSVTLDTYGHLTVGAEPLRRKPSQKVLK